MALRQQTMQKAVQSAVRCCADILFGRRCPYCGQAVPLSVRDACAACEKELVAVTRNKGVPIPQAGHALGHVGHAYAPFWYEGSVQNAVWRVKYQGVFSLAAFYAREMASCLCVLRDRQGDEHDNESVRTGDSVPLPYDSVVPVPTTLWEHRNRDNIPFALASALGKELGLPVHLHALKKTRETKRQMTLSGKERLENVKGAYTVRSPNAVRGKRILLVDDVLTTGSTLNECAAALRAAGAVECDAVCIAASEKF